MADEDKRTLWVGNLDSEQVTEDVLFELFLQAGPVQYIRIPKDKATGQQKSFAFIIFRDELSVAYGLELMNGISLFGRNMRVQSRGLQELKDKGMDPGPGGVHTLNPDLLQGQQRTRTEPQTCRQQNSLMGMSDIQNMMGGRVPSHILALAQQQMSMISGQQSAIPFAANTLVNGPSGYMGMQSMQPQSLMGRPSLMGNYMANRGMQQGLMGNFSQGVGGMQQQSQNQRNYLQGHNLTLQSDMMGGSSRSSYDRHGNGSRNSRGGDDRRNPPIPGMNDRYMDNASMKAMKSQLDRVDDSLSHNSDRLSQLQKNQGRFDYNRLGPGPELNRHHDNRGSSRPYDRYPSQRSSGHHDNRSHNRSHSGDRSDHSDHRSRHNDHHRSRQHRYDDSRSTRY